MGILILLRRLHREMSLRVAGEYCDYELQRGGKPQLLNARSSSRRHNHDAVIACRSQQSAQERVGGASQAHIENLYTMIDGEIDPFCEGPAATQCLRIFSARIPAGLFCDEI